MINKAHTAMSVIIVVALYWLLQTVMQKLGITFPPPVAAMALLFISFMLLARVPSFIDRAANILLKFLPLFFIPPAILALRHLDIIIEHGLWFLTAILLSSIAGMAATVWLYKLFSKREQG